jgi:hypothetical protein
MTNPRHKSLLFSGIRVSAKELFQKMNFQYLDDVRNFNGSHPINGLTTAAADGFGGFGVIMFVKNALLGSRTGDWGSVRFGSLLNLSDPNYRRNFLNIRQQRQRNFIDYFGGLQNAIQNTGRQHLEAIPESVQKIFEDFEPLLKELNKPKFNKEDFKKKYQEFCQKYQSQHQFFQDSVIQLIIKKINKILQGKNILQILQINRTPTPKDIEKIKTLLGEHFDAASRVENKIDKCHRLYGLTEYNEVHLPPLLQTMEGFFIIDDDDDAYNDIEKKLEIYKTIKDVRKILFLLPEHHTPENFKQLTPEQQESFKRFFCIDRSQELTFSLYQEKIDRFFKNQTEEYLIEEIDNISICFANFKQIKEIDKLISRYSDSIDRTKLPELLNKPFLLQLFDSKSQTIKTKQELIEKIQSYSTELQKQKLALFYVGLGVLDSAEYNKLNFNPLNINALELKKESEGRRKIIIAGALETKAIENLTFDNFKKLCGLVRYDVDYKYEIIIKALETKAIENLTLKL